MEVRVEGRGATLKTKHYLFLLLQYYTFSSSLSSSHGCIIRCFKFDVDSCSFKRSDKMNGDFREKSYNSEAHFGSSCSNLLQTLSSPNNNCASCSSSRLIVIEFHSNKKVTKFSYVTI
mmetsp:Transcript_21499/g.32226  ORF Transcript_21499/g.32226 Transcript_21499/m.32226 type:complete len:118 (-) Transcript_21499:122-475(-)